MPAPPADVSLPSSYNSLPFQDIRCSHYPESSATPTPVIVLTLNRPKAHNAFTGRMMTELEQAFQYFDLDDRVKCVVVTGSGRIFCAGADLTPGMGAFQGGKERVNDHRDGYVSLIMPIPPFRHLLIHLQWWPSVTRNLQLS